MQYLKKKTMDPKSTVVKSKSSNSGISKKSKEDGKRQSNKKTRSNADFPHHVLKKRGVYVEKRLAKLNLVNNVKAIDTAQRPSTRPRPGQKQFLASVLTILSKSTTGTQYPEVKDRKEITHKNKANLTRNVKNKIGNEVNTTNTKEKFKSRVLSKKCIKEDKKKMVVLQSKKEIAQTPSNYSEWSYKDASQKSNTSNYHELDNLNNNNLREHLNIADELKNALFEGRSIKKMKKLRYLEEDPKTLVSDEPKVQKNLYNFIVDLLETTISVYNIKAEYNPAVSDASKTNLQMNVENKLNIDKGQSFLVNNKINVNPQDVKIPYETDYDDDYISFQTKPIPIMSSRQELRPKTTKFKKIKADSFIHTNKKSILSKSKSLEINQKTLFKNKNDLINVLKQQLEIDTHVFEEPQRIFQALKVMARNKKRISFDPSIETKAFTDECVLKRRKVISSRKAKKNRNKNNVNSNNLKPKKILSTDNKYESRKKNKLVTDINKNTYNEIDKDSYHSLEVYGYDYELKQPQMYFNKSKDVTFTYHSSPSTSELDFDVTNAILNPLSESSIRKLSGAI